MAAYPSDDDEDLRRAIDLSLQDAAKLAESSHNVHIIDDSSETEDESANIQAAGQPAAHNIATLAKEITPPVYETQQKAGTLLGLNRKQMEEERLARAAKRKRLLDHDGSDQFSSAEERAKRLKAAPSSTSQSFSFVSTKKSQNGSDISISAQTIKYPQGAILKTFVRHHPRQRDITIEEVLQKEHLNTAIISAYTFNLSWLFSKLDTKRTKLILCMSAKSEAERHQLAKEAKDVGRGSIKVVLPPMEGEASIMHSKLMLLRYDRSLRIVVTSANVEMYDWGETGVMENSVFVIDLPELSDGQTQRVDDLTDFGKELLYFLERSTFDQKILDGLLKFDFSATINVGFVHSVGGANFGQDMRRTGFNSIARCINQLNLKPPPGLKLHVAYISASLGALSDSQLRSIVDASHGKLNTSMSTRATKGSLPAPITVRNNFTVIFPTNATVESSTGGPDNAGTICLRKDSYEQSTFPHEVLRDYTSSRRGTLSHAKMILAWTTGASKAQENKAWVFVGSHNFTESAWGKVVKDRSRNEMKIVCRNWECGVIVPVTGAIQESADGTKLKELFAPVVDVPCDVPGPKYGPDDEPWFFMDRRRWA